MIKANELRVGNLLLNHEAEPDALAIVESFWLMEDQWFIEWIDTKTNESIGAWSMEAFSRIPLTPEWLERCGFVDGRINYSYHTRLLIRPYETASQGVFPGKWRVTLIDTVPYSIGKQLEYVHQLQNLYFALTGEELNVKL